MNKNTTTTTTILRLRPSVSDYPGEPVPEETLTHPPSWSSSNLYQLLPSTTIHSILLVQITCLTIFLHNLFTCPLWSTSWSGASYSSYSVHFFTQSASYFRNTYLYHRSLFCCSINIISCIPSISLNSLLGTLSFTFTLHIHLTILISAHWSATWNENEINVKYCRMCVYKEICQCSPDVTGECCRLVFYSSTVANRSS